jgi:hypothetical protein
MRLAVCDPKAFYPLRNLVAGPLTDLSQLIEVERFIRTVVLHDEISMELEPWISHPEEEEEESKFTEEELQEGGRLVIVGIGPMLTGYDFFSERTGPGQPETPDIDLAPKLIEMARDFSNADEGNVYYDAHLNYLRRIIGIVRNGGSALLAGAFGSAAIAASTEYPEKLFEKLDQDWQEVARDADAGNLGFRVPPLLSIVLTRSAKREAIPAVINDLRAEWADARSKVWKLVCALEVAETVAEAQDIKRELTSASRMFSPEPNEIDSQPIRTLWEIVSGGGAGAATAMISGGRPIVGATIGAIGAASKSGVPLIHDLGSALFGRGAFDLAKRIRREIGRVEYDALPRLLSDAERLNLKL